MRQVSLALVALASLVVIPAWAGKSVSERMARGAALLQKGKAAEAVQVFNQVIADRPTGPAYYQRGVCYERLGDVRRAMVDYQRAIKLKPNLAEAHNNLGALLYAEGKLTPANKHLQRAVKLRPNYADAWFNLGLLHFSKRRFGVAVKAYKRAARLNPKDPSVRLNLAGALQGINDVDGALRQAALAAKLAPKNARAVCAYGELVAAKGKTSQAIRLLKRAADLDPSYLRAWQRLTRMQVRAGKLKAAQATVERGLSKQPRAPALHLLKGKVLRKSGNNAQAIVSYRRALALDRSQHMAHALIALAFDADKRCKQARAALGRLAKATKKPIAKLGKYLKNCAGKR